MPTISLAGTRASEQPIHRFRGLLASQFGEEVRIFLLDRFGPTLVVINQIL